MIKRVGIALAFVVGPFSGLHASAQETVEQLKTQGGTAVSGEELKALLSGATLRYENAQNSSQVRLDADGKLSGQSKRRVGGSGAGTAFDGTWHISDRGLWCLTTRSFGQGSGESNACRQVFKLGEKYFYAGSNVKNDSRALVEMSVNR